MGTRRLFLAAALALGALVGTASAQAVGGTVLGPWDLPDLGQHGFCQGQLILGATGPTLFEMKGALVESPNPGATVRRGTLDGVLVPLGSVAPKYTVRGVWRGHALSGLGRWRGAIYTADPIQQRVGRMGGIYLDPPTGVPMVGTYKGGWAIQ